MKDLTNDEKKDNNDSLANLEFDKLMKKVLEIIEVDEFASEESEDEEEVYRVREKTLKRVIVKDKEWKVMNSYAKTDHIKKIAAGIVKCDKLFGGKFKNLVVGKLGLYSCLRKVIF